mgnify:CR=1 FL=1
MPEPVQKAFSPKEIIKLHGFDIGVDKEAISPRILRGMMRGWYEEQELHIMKAMLAKGDRILELGSATGLSSMWAANIVGQENIFPFELNPYLVDWAHDNFSRNGFDIKVQQVALAATLQHAAPSIDFHIHEDFWASSLVKPVGNHETIQVPTACFEDAVSTHNINTLLIDIEGGEVDLFLKADITDIQKIIMEIHYDAVGKQATNAMLQHIVAQGFFLDHTISANGVVALYRM